MCKGWIKVNRRLPEHWLWTDKPFSKGQAWIDLLLLVNWEDEKLFKGGQLVTVNRGSALISYPHLAERWGWSRNKTISFLKLLVKEEMIRLDSTTKGTTLTIEKYNDYQAQSTAEGTVQSTADGTTESTAERKPTYYIKNLRTKEPKNKQNKDSAPYGEIVDAFHELCPSLPQCQRITETRKKHMRARFKTYSLEDFKTVFRNAEASDFLKANKTVGNIDWLLKSESNFQKTLEGRYNGTGTSYKSKEIDWDAI